MEKKRGTLVRWNVAFWGLFSGVLLVSIWPFATTGSAVLFLGVIIISWWNILPLTTSYLPIMVIGLLLGLSLGFLVAVFLEAWMIWLVHLSLFLFVQGTFSIVRTMAKLYPNKSS